jgi:hypothetical protein
MLRVLVAFALLGFAAGAGHANACDTCKAACATQKSTCTSMAVQGVNCDTLETQCNTACNTVCSGVVGGGSSDITTPNMPSSVNVGSDSEGFGDLSDLTSILALLQMGGGADSDLAKSVAAFVAEAQKCDDDDHEHDEEESAACKAAQEAGQKLISTACNPADTTGAAAGVTTGAAGVTTGPLASITMPSGGGDVSQACTLCKDACTNAETLCKTNAGGNAQVEAACAATVSSCNTACNTACGVSRLRRAANPVRRAGHADAASAHDYDDDDSIFDADFEATCKASTTCQAVFTDGSGETAINNIASACQPDMDKICDHAKEQLQCLKGVVPKMKDLVSQIKKALPTADIPAEMSNTDELEANITKQINDISAQCDIKSQYSLQAQIAAINCGITKDSIQLPAPSEDFVKLQAEALDKKIEENNCNGAGSETDICKQLLAEKEATDSVETTSAAKTIPSLVAVFVLGAVAQLF